MKVHSRETLDKKYENTSSFLDILPEIEWQSSECLGC